MKTLVAILVLFASTFSSAQALEDAPQPHKFLDKTNAFTMATAAVSVSLDGLSTQYWEGLGHYYEKNPIARPFVKTRRGDALYFGTSYAAMVGFMYISHRKGWHKLERLIPIAVTVSESAWVARNYSFHAKPMLTNTPPPGPITAGIDQVPR